MDLVLRAVPRKNLPNKVLISPECRLPFPLKGMLVSGLPVDVRYS